MLSHAFVRRAYRESPAHGVPRPTWHVEGLGARYGRYARAGYARGPARRGGRMRRELSRRGRRRRPETWLAARLQHEHRTPEAPRSTLDQLDPRQRRMLELSLGDGLSVTEIGKLMALSRHAADQQLRQAMRLLRVDLEEKASRIDDD